MKITLRGRRISSVALAVFIVGGLACNRASSPTGTTASAADLPTVAMPNVLNATENEARSAIEQRGLRLSVTTQNHPYVTAGHIAWQNPAPDYPTPVGATVLTGVSLGQESRPADGPAPVAPPGIVHNSPDGDNVAVETAPREETPIAAEEGGTPTEDPAPPAKEFLVCVDPGHPSETSAGANAGRLSENRLNWQVAQRLAKRLDDARYSLYLPDQEPRE